MKDKPILSIVIPSRNRQKYAIPCIQSILAIRWDKIEIIVQDNSDTNELEQYIKNNIKDNRLVYLYDSTPMSTVHNFNKAMESVSGEYICFIGDDDGVNPEIVDAVIWAKNNDLDAIVGTTMIDYYWPDDKRKGKQIIPLFTGKIRRVNIESELNRFLISGGAFYLNYSLPRIYHGVVRKKCFDKVKEEIGFYFGGLSVDIFSSIALSLVAKNVFSIDYPLTIAGSSAASEKTHRTKEAKKLDLRDAPHFREIGAYTWSEFVPAVYSRVTIWAESSIKVLETFSRTDLIKKIDKFKLAVLISLDEPHHEKYLLKEYLHEEDCILIKFRYNYTKFNILFSKLVRKFIRKISIFIYSKHVFNKKITNVNSIENAIDNFKIYSLKYSVNISKYLKS